MNEDNLTSVQRRIMHVMKGGGGQLGFDIASQSYFLDPTQEAVATADIEALDALGYINLTNYYFDGIAGATYHDLTPGGAAALARFEAEPS